MIRTDDIEEIFDEKFQKFTTSLDKNLHKHRFESKIPDRKVVAAEEITPSYTGEERKCIENC